MRSRLSCALLLLLISFAPTGSAHAEDADQLHADPTSVALEKGKASPLAVTNESGSPAVITGVAVHSEKPSNFAVFPEGSQPAFGSVLGLKPNQTLGPLETVSLRVQMKEAASAELVIAVKPVNQQTPGQVLTISLGEASTGKWAAPANGDWSSTAWRHPGSDADLRIPLSKMCTGQPEPVTAVLGSGSKQLTAKATCKEGEDFARLALTPSADPGITYKGTLHLLGDDKDGDVAITLRGKDRPWWPIVVIVAGVLAGLPLRRFKGVDQKLQPLRSQLDDLAKRPGVHTSPGGRRLVGCEKAVADLRGRLSALGKNHLFDISDDDPGYKELVSGITALGSQLDDFATLEDACDVLTGRLQTVKDEPTPTFVAEARASLPRDALTADEVASGTKDVNAWIEFITTYRHWSADLDRLERSLGRRQSVEAKAARKRLQDARSQLRSILGPDDQRSEDFGKTVSDIADDVSKVVDQREALQAMAPAGHRPPGRALAPEEGALPQDKGSGFAKKQLHRLPDVNWLAVAAGVVVALWTAMQALYVGKDFGTPTDYLGAFFWGLITPAALDTVVATLNRLRPAAA